MIDEGDSRCPKSFLIVTCAGWQEAAEIAAVAIMSLN